MIPITGAILTYNEAAIIAATITHIKRYVAEVIVADTGSTDNTVRIATEAGARVINLKWENDFALIRNEALKEVKTEWCLYCDADERYSSELLNLLSSLYEYSQSTPISAFYFWRVSVFDGEIRGEEYQLRLIKVKDCVWTGKVHEGLEIKGKRADAPKSFVLWHEHTMARQRWNNLLYQRLQKGKDRPPANIGAEERNGKWVEFENERDGG